MISPPWPLEYVAPIVRTTNFERLLISTSSPGVIVMVSPFGPISFAEANKYGFECPGIGHKMVSSFWMCISRLTYSRTREQRVSFPKRTFNLSIHVQLRAFGIALAHGQCVIKIKFVFNFKNQNNGFLAKRLTLLTGVNPSVRSSCGRRERLIELQKWRLMLGLFVCPRWAWTAAPSNLKIRGQKLREHGRSHGRS